MGAYGKSVIKGEMRLFYRNALKAIVASVVGVCALSVIAMSSADTIEESSPERGRILFWGSPRLWEFENLALSSRILLNARFRDVAIGHSHIIALGYDNDLYAWAFNDWGDRQGQVSKAPDGKFQKVASTFHLSLALDGNGGIHVWGTDHKKILDHPEGEFVDIAAGGATCYAIDNEGKIHAWGVDARGSIKDTPSGQFKAIDARRRRAVAIDVDGAIHEWGNEPTYKPTGGFQPAPEGEFIDIAVGHSHNIAIDTEGKLHSWGAMHRDLVTLHDVPDGEFVAVAAGQIFSMAIDSDGILHVWGSYRDSALYREAPRGRVLAISAGRRHAAAILDPRDREDQP